VRFHGVWEFIGRVAVAYSYDRQNVGAALRPPELGSRAAPSGLRRGQALLRHPALRALADTVQYLDNGSQLCPCSFFVAQIHRLFVFAALVHAGIPSRIELGLS
jgi:hypothetical protein